jgi:hypothetical protein
MDFERFNGFLVTIKINNMISSDIATRRKTIRKSINIRTITPNKNPVLRGGIFLNVIG